MDVNQVINVIWEMSRENDRLEFERRKLQLEINNLKHENEELNNRKFIY